MTRPYVDFCKHCTCRGNYKECLETFCSYHGSWMNQEKDKKITESESIIESLEISLAEKERIIGKLIDEILAIRGGRG